MTPLNMPLSRAYTSTGDLSRSDTSSKDTSNAKSGNKNSPGTFRRQTSSSSSLSSGPIANPANTTAGGAASLAIAKQPNDFSGTPTGKYLGDMTEKGPWIHSSAPSSPQATPQKDNRSRSPSPGGYKNTNTSGTQRFPGLGYTPLYFGGGIPPLDWAPSPDAARKFGWTGSGFEPSPKQTSDGSAQQAALGPATVLNPAESNMPKSVGSSAAAKKADITPAMLIKIRDSSADSSSYLLSVAQRYTVLNQLRAGIVPPLRCYEQAVTECAAAQGDDRILLQKYIDLMVSELSGPGERKDFESFLFEKLTKRVPVPELPTRNFWRRYVQSPQPPALRPPLSEKDKERQEYLNGVIHKDDLTRRYKDSAMVNRLPRALGASASYPVERELASYIDSVNDATGNFVAALRLTNCQRNKGEVTRLSCVENIEALPAALDFIETRGSFDDVRLNLFRNSMARVELAQRIAEPQIKQMEQSNSASTEGLFDRSEALRRRDFHGIIDMPDALAKFCLRSACLPRNPVEAEALVRNTVATPNILFGLQSVAEIMDWEELCQDAFCDLRESSLLIDPAAQWVADAMDKAFRRKECASPVWGRQRPPGIRAGGSR